MSTDLMNAPVYDALREAGASEDKARAAARSVADYATRLAAIDTRLTVLAWMAGFNIVLTLVLLGIVLRLGGRS